MWRYTQLLQNLYETPQLLHDPNTVADQELAASILEDARKSGRNLLTEFESKSS